MRAWALGVPEPHEKSDEGEEGARIQEIVRTRKSIERKQQ